MVVTMESRDRILSVIQGKEPDRVPVCIFIHDEGNFLLQVYPELDLRNPLDCKYKLIDLERELGVDLFIRLLHGIYPDWIVYGGFNTEEQTETWEPSTEEIRSANTILRKTKVITPDGTLEQEFTVSESTEVPGTYWYACTKKPVTSPKDLDILRTHEPQMGEDFPGHVKVLIQKVKEYIGNDGIVSVWVPGAAYNHASHLIELDDLYSLFFTDYSFYEKLLNYCIQRTFPFLKVLAEAGVDVMCMGGNVPGGFLGAKNYERYVLPFEKKYFNNTQTLGVKALYHNCGEIMALADLYKKLGADIVEPFAPPPLGDGNLERAKRISKGAYTIVGNVDQVNVLKMGTLQDVERVTRETTQIGKKGGRFILQTADYLEHGTPIDNVKKFVETGLTYARY
jgi:uroporphyrinogen-III decarboxylase